MFHVDNSTGVPVMPQPSPVTSETELFFTEGGNGVPPTHPGPDWFNAIQSELLNILRSAGLKPDKMTNTQILSALKKLFLSRSNPFGDIKTDGPEAIAKALANLRLGAGAPAIGIPFFWLSSAMPNTVIDEWSDMVFLKLNGATFSAENYQQLALMVPSLRLPDTRGEFLRIWDDGRGIDSGRGLLSFQAATSFTQYAGNYDVGSGHAIGNHDGVVDYSAGFSRFPYPGPAVGDGVNHVTVRPRNIAFNFLVRAK
ncbi:integrase [Citrobacter freundii]